MIQKNLSISIEELQQLGTENIVYAKPNQPLMFKVLSHPDLGGEKDGYTLYAADGTVLATLPDKETLEAALNHNELTLLSVH
jgi:hypothetical protein